MSHIKIVNTRLLTMCQSAKEAIKAKWFADRKIRRANIAKGQKWFHQIFGLYTPMSTEEALVEIDKHEEAEGGDGYKYNRDWYTISLLESAANRAAVVYLDIEDLAILERWNNEKLLD